MGCFPLKQPKILRFTDYLRVEKELLARSELPTISGMRGVVVED